MRLHLYAALLPRRPAPVSSCLRRLLALLVLHTFCLAAEAKEARIAISIQTFSGHHFVVEVGRETWRAVRPPSGACLWLTSRQGVSTVVITNGTVEQRIESPAVDEVWFEAPDDKAVK